MNDITKIHYMTLPRAGKHEWDPRMTMTSPVEWETSPLVTSADNDSIVSTPLSRKKKETPDIISDNEARQILPNDIPDVISNNEASYQEKIDNNNTTQREDNTRSQRELLTSKSNVTLPHVPRTAKKLRSQSEIYTKPNRKSRSGSHDGKGHRSKSLYTSKERQSEEGEHFIIVNVPENAFTPSHLDARNHNTVLSVADDTATVVSEGVKCRYCLTNDTLNEEPLISPCDCCGTSKFVHKSCLEKWLTLRNLDACEVCKTKYKTKWVHRPLCSVSVLFFFFSSEKFDTTKLVSYCISFMTY